jgi:predicted house-cleaning noncanonical NTP pyrophosphatase (MazG superfamily)
MHHTHTETDLPIENQYPKLVRNKIPVIVERGGMTAETKVITNTAELLHYLLRKLVEESTELSGAEGIDHQKEELADVYEVLNEIESTLGLTHHEVAETQTSKREERGGFSEHIVMLSRPE